MHGFADHAQLAGLVRRAYLWGPLYGVAVYLFMQFVVFPLSAIGSVRHPLPRLLDGIVTHVFCVGLPAAVVTREARRLRESGPA